MVDSEPLARQSWVMALNDFGRVLDDSIFDQMIGLRRMESVRLVKQALDLPVSSAELLSLKESYLSEIMADGVPAMPGMEQLVNQLDQRQMPWAVATSSPRHYGIMVLEQLGLAAGCRAIAGGDEVSHGKPAPDVYLLAAERLNQKPVECLALEDSVPGAQAGKAAGMVTIAVPGGHTTAKDFDFADYVFDSLVDVIRYLDQLINCSF